MTKERVKNLRIPDIRTCTDLEVLQFLLDRHIYVLDLRARESAGQWSMQEPYASERWRKEQIASLLARITELELLT